MARLGLVWRGRQVKVWLGTAGQGTAGRGRQGSAWQRMARYGRAGLGKARQGEASVMRWPGDFWNAVGACKEKTLLAISASIDLFSVSSYIFVDVV